MLPRTTTAKNHISTQSIPGRRIWHPCQITKEHRKLTDAAQAHMFDQKATVQRHDHQLERTSVVGELPSCSLACPHFGTAPVRLVWNSSEVYA